MRIALDGISHETNTYCAGTTPKGDFYTLRGRKMLNTAGQESDVGGAVDACSALDCEAVPILFASTQPSGLVERSAYEEFKAEIITGLAQAGVLDGCVLLLHGAGVVECLQDSERNGKNVVDIAESRIDQTQVKRKVFGKFITTAHHKAQPI